MDTVQLFHTGYSVIETPDLKIGRKNADFGQGFYLSADEDFSRRWARSRSGQTTYLNVYELDLSGLAVRRFTRDEEWFGYIYANRRGQPDAYAEYDVIIGPIANDTIYDTWGLLTSGLVDRETAVRILMIGNAYEQTVIKTEKGAGALRFIRAVALSGEEIAACRETVRKEEEDFQEQFAALLADPD